MISSGGRHTILGIDPGTATMGWGVIRQEGNRLRYMQHGAITTPPDWEMPRRLGRLFDGVTELVRGYMPETIAVEELFFNTNVTTAITVGQARGVALLAAYKAGIEVAEYTLAGQTDDHIVRKGGQATGTGDGESPPEPSRNTPSRRRGRRPGHSHLPRFLQQLARQGRGGEIVNLAR